jgi:predicted nucleotidyltransferase
MISNDDKSKIRKISKRYHAKNVLLFGSGALPGSKNNDIDIAVDGIPAKNFYKYCGDLLFSLSKPVDVVDLSGKSKFIQMIRREGVVIYG